MNKPNVLILFLSLLSFTLMQCEQSEGREKSSNPYTGEWALVSITGGITGNGYNADFSTLFIGNDGSYWIGDSNTQMANGTYLINKKEQEQEDWVHFDSSTPNDRHIFEIADKMIALTTEGNLILAEPCCDMYSYEFQKIKDDER